MMCQVGPSSVTSERGWSDWTSGLLACALLATFAVLGGGVCFKAGAESKAARTAQQLETSLEEEDEDDAWAKYDTMVRQPYRYKSAMSFVPGGLLLRLLLLLPLLLLLLPVDATAAPVDFEVLVYDATAGGIAAAVAAARGSAFRGAPSVALLCASWPACFPEGGLVLGGMSSSGLGQTDIGATYPYLGGIAHEFYARNWQRYTPKNTNPATGAGSSCRLPSSSCNVTFNLEPHVAQDIFTEMLKEASVHVFFAAQVTSVTKQPSDPTKIASIALADGRNFSARVFLDASYEGDLLAMAGASFAVGRESAAAFNESLAGVSAGSRSNQFSLPVDPFNRTTGEPLPLTAMPEDPMPPVGAGDTKVQSYNFRLCVTKDPANRVSFPKPVGYDTNRWELLRRYLVACEATSSCQLGFPSCNTASIPGNAKFDMNNCGGISSDFIGASNNYPRASWSERQNIWLAHLQYQQGLLYFMQSDALSPVTVRNAMRPWGLCADEFAENTLAPHWPPSLYVRAARRLRGSRIFTQNTPHEQRLHFPAGIGNISIGIGGYNFDSHNAQRLACRDVKACFGAGHAPADTKPEQSFVWDEGDVETAPGLYQIPNWVMLPRRDEVTNLLVVAAPSTTHIGMSTLRMEPQEMVIGQAAGVTAGLAVVAGDSTVQDVSSARLYAELKEAGAILAAK